MAQGTLIGVSAQFLRLLIQLVGSAILARLLMPADFGLVAMAATVIGFVGLFTDLGLSTATIQRKTLDYEVVNVLFAINVLAGFGLMLASICAAPVAAWIYDNPQVTLLIIGLSVSLPISASGAQHNALLSRDMRWLALNMIWVVSQLAGLVTAIMLAWQTDVKYWALVAGGFVGAFVNTALLWIASPWRPTWTISWRAARPEISFGLHLSGFSLINYFHRQFDNVLIGWRWGETELGYYSRAYNLLLLPLTLVSGPISSVIVPILSRCQDAPSVWRRHFIAAFSAILYLGYFIGAVFIPNAESIIYVVMGSQWHQTVPIFKYLSISLFASSPMNAMGWIYVSTGQTRRLLFWSIFGTSVIILSFVIGLPYRAEGLALAYSIAICTLLLPCIAYGTYRSPVTFFMLLRLIIGPFISAILSIVITSILAPEFNHLHPFMQMITGMFITFVTYVALASLTIFTDPAQRILRERLIRFAFISRRPSSEDQRNTRDNQDE